MDIGTLTAAIARIQAEVDSNPRVFLPETSDDIYDNGYRLGLIEARRCLQNMLELELNDRDHYAERVANEQYGEV